MGHWQTQGPTTGLWTGEEGGLYKMLQSASRRPCSAPQNPLTDIPACPLHQLQMSVMGHHCLPDCVSQLRPICVVPSTGNREELSTSLPGSFSGVWERCFLQPGFKAWLGLGPGIPRAQHSDKVSAQGRQEPQHSHSSVDWVVPQAWVRSSALQPGRTHLPPPQLSSALADAKLKYIIKLKCCQGCLSSSCSPR